ncbi:hypothetical protein [Halobacillus salinus]|uniref:hypothetical protein n=1 Tax=Halobacillus salinus TaxID=192814 RepID=UPI0009A5BD1C|nr:hypothetical protein [Halobacillus salinus]
MSNYEDKISSMILRAGSLPGFKVHPYDTYNFLNKNYNVGNLDHPKEVYFIDENKLKLATGQIVAAHKLKFATTGFAAGAPGGLWGVTAGTALDLEEYVRRLFLMAQQMGHIYGLIPNPFAEEVDLDEEVYFESVQDEIVKLIALGLGVGGVSLTLTETSKALGVKKARDIARHKVSEELTTRVAKKVAGFLGKKLTKNQIAKGVSRAVPVIGGGINAGFNYVSIGGLGRKMATNLEKEHIRLKPQVLDHWQ